ncbi:DNA-binding response regulator [Pseudonocardia aurantiaca]|uniref:DNA-binding response regulator n=1 Tax=Pseudonocardia aurantiaca TaxID=75290 RepID=A0ABW4FRR6_9PSEU
MGSILICDDRRAARESMTRAMSAVAGVLQIECVADGDDLLERYSRRPGRLVMIGVRSAGLLDPMPVLPPPRPELQRRHRAELIVRQLLAAFPRADAVLFGRPDCASVVAAAVAAGARGYVRWDGQRLDGGESATSGWLQPQTAGGAANRAGADGIKLTERELQVLRGMTRGLSNGEIARELHLSEDTVKTHARRLFRKLGAGCRAHAVAHGLRLGLVS